MRQATDTTPDATPLRETAFQFSRGGVRLFGVEHRPDGPSTSTGFILAHAFAEEKLRSHRVLLSLARALAARGHVVLRFDFTGAGDSEGDTAHAGVNDFDDDLAAAFDALQARHPSLTRVGLVGLRLGATVAARFAEACVGSDRHAALHGAPLVLWEPVLDGNAYLQDLLRSGLTAQLVAHGRVSETREVMRQRIRDGGTVNVDGYEIGLRLLDSCIGPDLAGSDRKRHSGPTLVVGIAPAERLRARADLERFAASYGRGALVSVDEAPFWREIRRYYGRAANLETHTLAWLAATDA